MVWNYLYFWVRASKGLPAAFESQLLYSREFCAVYGESAWQCWESVNRVSPHCLRCNFLVKRLEPSLIMSFHQCGPYLIRNKLFLYQTFKYSEITNTAFCGYIYSHMSLTETYTTAFLMLISIHEFSMDN